MKCVGWNLPSPHVQLLLIVFLETVLRLRNFLTINNYILLHDKKFSLFFSFFFFCFLLCKTQKCPLSRNLISWFMSVLWVFYLKPWSFLLVIEHFFVTRNLFSQIKSHIAKIDSTKKRPAEVCALKVPTIIFIIFWDFLMFY